MSSVLVLLFCMHPVAPPLLNKNIFPSDKGTNVRLPGTLSFLDSQRLPLFHAPNSFVWGIVADMVRSRVKPLCRRDPGQEPSNTVFDTGKIVHENITTALSFVGSTPTGNESPATPGSMCKIIEVNYTVKPRHS